KWFTGVRRIKIIKGYCIFAVALFINGENIIMDEFIANIGARVLIALFLGLIGYGIAKIFINMFIMPFTKES
ncbi:MAG: hypothetical protein IIW72_07100, partial [Clostridia bacterium]|nr:hypothetical protein [Clostridia bacterium]